MDEAEREKYEAIIADMAKLLELQQKSEGVVIDMIAAAVKAEREALADILLEYAGRDDLSDSDESLLKHLFDLIRARGET